MRIHSFGILIRLLPSLVTLVVSPPVFAWGDEGHEIVALIADHYLEPPVHAKVVALLAKDQTKLTSQDMAHEATWADKFRDSDRSTTQIHYNETYHWHFVDLEIDQPNMNVACNRHPGLPPRQLASSGPANDCIVAKIDQFVVELKSPKTTSDERLEALQFVLHFIGDLHQPLHASDNLDQGGNMKKVVAPKLTASNLHAYWDSQFVETLGKVPQTVADGLITKITPTQAVQWRKGNATDWAMESYGLAKTLAYGQLPTVSKDGVYHLSGSYVSNASSVIATQLSRAGVRLAMILNDALK
ncbi:MAG TPA: S1/P1 nuclease [Rhodocyclaceae bacterium]|nr:S1/P1 nuclease [Rhodocyclaceae bacterium]